MSVLDDIAAERRRQIEVEYHTAEFDDVYNKDGQLAAAAACYALTNSKHWARDQAVKTFWPYLAEWWKPRDARRDLIRAAALLVAEIDRLDRAARSLTPVDRSAVELASGLPVTDDHREINPETGLQKGYVVLRPEERAKGFVRPFRDAYRHLTCNAITTMSRSIAETYARDPYFYSGTFCSTCRAHFPVSEDGEFTWYEMDGTEGPKVGT